MQLASDQSFVTNARNYMLFPPIVSGMVLGAALRANVACVPHVACLYLGIQGTFNTFYSGQRLLDRTFMANSTRRDMTVYRFGLCGYVSKRVPYVVQTNLLESFRSLQANELFRAFPPVPAKTHFKHWIPFLGMWVGLLQLTSPRKRDLDLSDDLAASEGMAAHEHDK